MKHLLLDQLGLTRLNAVDIDILITAVGRQCLVHARSFCLTDDAKLSDAHWLSRGWIEHNVDFECAWKLGIRCLQYTTGREIEVLLK